MTKLQALFFGLFYLNSVWGNDYQSQRFLEEIPEEEKPSWGGFYRKHVGLGNYFDLPFVYQNTSKGEKNHYEFWPVINAGGTHQGAGYDNSMLQWNMMLSFPKSVGTSDLTRIVLSLDFLLGHNFQYLGSLSAGISFFEQFLFFRQTGETQTEGTTASGRFYRPSRWVIVSQQTLTLSYSSYQIANHYVINFKTYIFSLWQSKERENSYAFNLMYQW